MFLVRSGYISKSGVKTERKRFLIILAVYLQALVFRFLLLNDEYRLLPPGG